MDLDIELGLEYIETAYHNLRKARIALKKYRWAHPICEENKIQIENAEKYLARMPMIIESLEFGKDKMQ